MVEDDGSMDKSATTAILCNECRTWEWIHEQCTRGLDAWCSLVKVPGGRSNQMGERMEAKPNHMVLRPTVMQTWSPSNGCQITIDKIIKYSNSILPISLASLPIANPTNM